MTLLTIAIPSYSDAKMLNQTLANLTKLSANLSVEVCVSDNASEDDSLAVMQSFDGKFGVPYFWIRQHENRGFLGNLHFLSNQGSGKYIWFMGIGETLEINFLPELLKHLSRDEFAFGTVGSFIGVVDQAEAATDEHIEFLISKQVEDLPVYSETISLNIFRRVAAIEYFDSKSVSTGNWWPHIELALSMCRANSEVNYFHVPTKMVGIAENFDGWWFDMPTAAELAWAQIELLTFANKSPVKNAWIEKRTRHYRQVWIGEILLRMRKQGHVVEFNNELNAALDNEFTAVEIFALFLAIQVPLPIFKLLEPLARRFGL
jgi:glycosyltransferase involved in cell wall biosynthesis